MSQTTGRRRRQPLDRNQGPPKRWLPRPLEPKALSQGPRILPTRCPHRHRHADIAFVTLSGTLYHLAAVDVGAQVPALATSIQLGP